MRKSFGYPELPTVGRGKPCRNPFSERRRIATDIHHNVARRSSHYPNKLSLGMGRNLVVKPPQGTLERYRMIFLDKIQGLADRLLEGAPPVGFKKLTAFVGKNYRLEKNEVPNEEGGRLHQRFSRQSGSGIAAISTLCHRQGERAKIFVIDPANPPSGLLGTADFLALAFLICSYKIAQPPTRELCVPPSNQA
jgi:hypothetical protein